MLKPKGIEIYSTSQGNSDLAATTPLAPIKSATGGFKTGEKMHAAKEDGGEEPNDGEVAVGQVTQDHGEPLANVQ